jgi:hypothetical protein
MGGSTHPKRRVRRRLEKAATTSASESFDGTVERSGPGVFISIFVVRELDGESGARRSERERKGWIQSGGVGGKKKRKTSARAAARHHCSAPPGDDHLISPRLPRHESGR